MTRTPSPVKRSTESLGAILAIDAMDVVMDGAMIDLGFEHVDAEGRGGPNRIGALGGGEQRLGGDAAIVQAIAAHQALFDQHDGDAQLGGGRSHRKTARAPTYYAEVGC